MKKIIQFIIAGVFILISNYTSAQSNSTLYFGGDIITMEGNTPQYPQSIVIQNGKIVFVGSKTNALKKYPKVKTKDLKGMTLLPAFLDASCSSAALS